jgi:hypothetical protein
MSESFADLQRIGLKLFAADGTAVRPHEFVPVFHRWIQQKAVDQMLIDVADYEHVPDGPGIVLVAHEGNYSVDLGDGAMGLMYYRKQPSGGDLDTRLASLVRTVLHAAQLLEQEPALGGRVRFRADQLELFANDRLRAPNVEASYTAFHPHLHALLTRLYGDAACTVTRPTDARDRFGLRISAPMPATVAQLLARLG